MANEKLTELYKGVLDSLTDEQREKALACNTPDEFIALASKEGFELPDEVIETVSAGYIFKNGSGQYEVIDDTTGDVKKTFSDWEKAWVSASGLGARAEWIDARSLWELRRKYQEQQNPKPKKKGC